MVMDDKLIEEAQIRSRINPNCMITELKLIIPLYVTDRLIK